MISNIFAYPGVVEEVSTILIEMFVIDVRCDVVVVTVSRAEVGTIIDVASSIGVEVFTGVNANVLVVSMAALEFDMTASLEESMRFR